MGENTLSLGIETKTKHIKAKHMYKKGKYQGTDKMSDLICDNYPMLLVMSRFGIAMGFGEKSIIEVCKLNSVDSCTFLTVVNFLLDENTAPIEISQCLSVDSLISYLQQAHNYFLDFRLPHIRRKLEGAITDCPKDIVFVVMRFFDEYAGEVNKHMMYEEKTVFPYVRQLLKGERDPRYNISIFRKKHDHQIESKLTELKNILIKYYPGQSTNLLNSVLFDIFSCEQDLVSHCKVEDYLFTPAILEMEKQQHNPTR